VNVIFVFVPVTPVGDTRGRDGERRFAPPAHCSVPLRAVSHARSHFHRTKAVFELIFGSTDPFVLSRYHRAHGEATKRDLQSRQIHPRRGAYREAWRIMGLNPCGFDFGRSQAHTAGLPVIWLWPIAAVTAKRAWAVVVCVRWASPLWHAGHERWDPLQRFWGEVGWPALRIGRASRRIE